MVLPEGSSFNMLDFVVGARQQIGAARFFAALSIVAGSSYRKVQQSSKRA